MTMHSKVSDRDRLAALAREVGRLREQVQLRARHNDVLERHLRHLHDRYDLSPETVHVADEVLPAGDGVSLHRTDAATTAYRGTPASSAPAADAPGDWWPITAKPKRPLVPNAGWFNHALQGRATVPIGVSVCGLARAELRDVVATIARTQAERQTMTPVFLYDGVDFDIFREYGFVFERLPGRDERTHYSGNSTWADYCRQRRKLVERKWRLARVITFGETEFGEAETPESENAEPLVDDRALCGANRPALTVVAERPADEIATGSARAAGGSR